MLDPATPLEDLIKSDKDVPFCFYFGDDDWMPWNGAFNIVKKLERAEIVQISKSGHNIPLENPKELAEQMLVFLKDKEVA